MTREVVVGGFDVGGFDDCEVTGVEDGGRVVSAVGLGLVDGGWVVGLLVTGAEVGSLTGPEVLELVG